MALQASLSRRGAVRRHPELGRDLAAYLLCLISPLLFVGWPLFIGRVLVVGDMLAQYWPYRDLWATYIRSGTLPLWNPYVFAGMPFLGDPQFAALHPLNVLFLLLPPLAAIQLYGLAAYALLAAFTYHYIRTLGRSRLAGLVAAFSLSFGLFMVIHWSHITIIHCIVWLPLQLALSERLAATRRARYGGLLAAALALQIYSGHPQFLFYSWLVLGAYQVGHVIAAGRHRRELLLQLGVAALGGLLLGSLQLLPSLELAQASSRQAMSYEAFSDYSLRPILLLQLLAPFLFGSPARFPYTHQPFVSGWNYEVVFYGGALAALCLVSAATLRRWAGWRETFWWLVLAWGVVFALGKYTPLYRFVYRLPVYNLFRVAGRHLFLVSLALAMITGLRVDALLQAGRRAIIGTWGALLALAAVLVAYSWGQEGAALAAHYGQGPGRLELLLPLLTFTLLFLILWPFGDGAHRQRWPTRALLLGLVAGDLFLTASTVAPSAPPSEAIHHAAEFQDLAAGLPHDGERFWHLPPLPGSNNYLFAPLPFATSYNPLIIQRYARLAHFQGVLPTSTLWKLPPRPRESLLDLLHVGYLLTPQKTVERPLLNPDCTQRIEGFCFTSLRNRLELQPGEQVVLPWPDSPERQLGLLSSLGYSVNVPDRSPVAQVAFLDSNYARLRSFPLLAGVHTAEWAADCLPPGQEIQHHIPPAAYAWPALDGHGNPCQGQAYLATIPVDPEPEPAYILIQNTDDHSALLLRGLSLRSADGAAGYNLQTGLYRALLPSSDPDWMTENWAVYHRPAAWGHAWPVERVQVMADSDFLQAFEDPQQAALDLGHVAYMDASDLPAEWQGRSDLQALRFAADADLQITELAPNALTLQVRSAAPALIVLSEIYYPGWSARIDDREGEVLRVDYALRGVLVPQGAHTVRLLYRPRSAFWGLALGLAGLGLLAAYAGRPAFRRLSNRARSRRR